jgi:hypothetical protein
MRIEEEVLENGTKIVVLGDKNTEGASFAVAHVSLPEVENSK